MCERGVDCTFGQPACIGDGTHTGADIAPFVSRSLTVEMQVNDERSRLLIVPDQITHQDIQHIIVDWNGAFEARHKERMKEEVRKRKPIRLDYTDKRTAVSHP